ncbi:MAG: Mov34/MPN/PAD-1 family protein [Ktedonobacteraceae bacterium]|nr:Mov34/MPN/PAD-1 family protein [Ktedonobacteraceae bacterium]
MTRLAHAQVTLTHKALRTIYQDIAQRPSIEACGVLLGTLDEQNNWHIEQAQPLCNIFSSPVYFEFDPEELLMVELAHPEQIIGVYHSHPTGFARASSTDRENMQRVNQQQRIPWIWLIVCGPFDEDFEQRSLEHHVATSMIAYHHYEQEGLCKVQIQLEQVQENISSALSWDN